MLSLKRRLAPVSDAPRATQATGPRRLGDRAGASRAAAARRRRGREGVKPPGGGKGRGRGPRLRSAALHCLHGGEERRRAQPGTRRGGAGGGAGSSWSESATRPRLPELRLAARRRSPPGAWRGLGRRPWSRRPEAGGRTRRPQPSSASSGPVGGLLRRLPAASLPPSPAAPPAFGSPGAACGAPNPRRTAPLWTLRGKHALGSDRFKFLVWDPRPPASSAPRVFSFFFFFFPPSRSPF